MIEKLKVRIPDYAKDMKLNLSSLSQSNVLTKRQLWGSLLAAALACRNKTVIKEIREEAATHLNEAELRDVYSVFAVMQMNNIYYRSLHLLLNKEYLSMPARLRMNALANPSMSKADFELCALVVSAINGCGMCLDAHEKEVTSKGLGKEAVQEAVKVAAVIHAISSVVE